MSGRGRGRFGGGRGGLGRARQDPFILFPEVELPDQKNVQEERKLFFWNWRLQNYWKSSPYFLEESDTKKGQSMDIERYSDVIKPKTTWERGSLDQFLQLGSNNFPKELDGGLRRGQAKKKVRWDPGSDLQKLDNWEQKEQKGEERDKEKKEGEEEEEDEEANAAEEEYSDDGDYNQNEYFDDDEDDFNADDGGDDDEGIL